MTARPTPAALAQFREYAAHSGLGIIAGLLAEIDALTAERDAANGRASRAESEHAVTAAALVDAQRVLATALAWAETEVPHMINEAVGNDPDDEDGQFLCEPSWFADARGER